jgi:predicted nucleotidyltransferase
MLEINNDTSKENVPVELLILVDEVKAVYKQISGDKLVAIYLAGSIPRGQFRSGKSDADFYAIVNIPKNSDSVKAIKEKLLKLGKKWIQRGVTNVDSKILYLEEINHTKNRRTAFIIQTDAICIYGQPVDLSFSIPENVIDLATLMNKLAKIRLRKIENRLSSGLSQEKDIRRITKLTIRCAYGLALLAGAPYAPDYTIYQREIEKFVPELSEKIKRQIALSESSNIPTIEMVVIAHSIIKLAENKGIIFL